MAGNNVAPEVVLDPLQQALNDADQLMSDLNLNLEASTSLNGDSHFIGGFSIDEDDDLVDAKSANVVNIVKNDEDDRNNEDVLHPLHEVFIGDPLNSIHSSMASSTSPSATMSSSTAVTVDAATTENATANAATTSATSAASAASISTTNPSASSFVSYASAPSHPQPPQQQLPHPLQPQQDVVLDAFKSLTSSKLATGLASFAQRAATTVAAQGAAVAAATLSSSNSSNNNTMNMTSPMIMAPPPPSPNYYGQAGPYNMSPSSLPQNPSSPTANSRSIETQQILSALDKEQIQILLEEYVGPLLPGEAIIMSLTNLLMVESSRSQVATFDALTITTMSPTNRDRGGYGGGTPLWCCVMTFYRLILFNPHPTIVKKMGAKQSEEDQTAPPTIDPSVSAVTSSAITAAPVDEHEEWRSSWNAACFPPSEMENRGGSARRDRSTVIEIPLASIDKVEKVVFASSATIGSGASNSSQLSLRIHSKLGETVRFSTLHCSDTMKALESLSTYAFPGKRNLGYLFAFESKRQNVMGSIVTRSDGTKTVTLPAIPCRFVAIHEFSRQLQNNHRWSIYTQINAGYQTCASYPSVIVGPSSIRMDDTADGRNLVSQCASFRSEGRWPCLTWACSSSGASIWRSSQPKVGLQGNRSPHDEWYLRQIAECAGSAIHANTSDSTTSSSSNLKTIALPPPISLGLLTYLTGSPDLTNWIRPSLPQDSLTNQPTRSLKILDLRPKASAMANRTGGYGYENTSHYPGTTIQFCGIGNIHAVRDSYQKLLTVTTSNRIADINWVSAIEDTKWLSHIRHILLAAWETAFWIQVHRLPVLLHCSHGWDRTSQVAALSQLLLDPYYRTRQGFAVLIEKDFMAFGHPFHTRCSHGEGKGLSDNSSASGVGGVASNISSGMSDEGHISPIFLQFLDAAYQIVSLYPECFEFNTQYLLILSEHIYSCRFGNFLCDTEKEREQAGIRQRTHCLWDYLDSRSDLVNPKVSKGSDGNGNYGVLLMPLATLLRHVHLWADRHCRYSPKPTTRWLPSHLKYSDELYPTTQELQRLLLTETAPITDTSASESAATSTSESAAVETPSAT